MKLILFFLSFLVIGFQLKSQNLDLQFCCGQLGFATSDGCTDPNSVCWVGPNWISWGPNQYCSISTKMKATHGCLYSPFWTGNGLEFTADNLNNGTKKTGDGMAIAYNFKKGYTYTISLSAGYGDNLYDPSTRPYKNKPTLQLQVTNTLSLGSTCAINAPPIDIYSSTNPYFEASDNAKSFTFTANNCYSYLWLSSKPNVQESGGFLFLDRIIITEQVFTVNSWPINFCGNSQVYSIPNAPTGSIKWALIPSSGPGHLSCTQCDQTTLIKDAGGAVTLKATITDPCTSIITNLSKNISIGKVAPTAINQGVYTDYDFEVFCSPVVGANSYNWYKNNVLISNQHTDQADIVAPCGVYYNIGVEAISSCGTSSKTSKSIKITCGGGTKGEFTISPNPSKGEFIVSSVPLQSQNGSKGLAQKKLYKLKILNQNGSILKILSFNPGVINTQLHLNDLNNGIYFLKLYDGIGWTTQQIIIKNK